MAIHVCARCGEEYEAVRSDARFCSTRCRVYAHTQLNKAESAEAKRLLRAIVSADVCSVSSVAADARAFLARIDRGRS